MPRPSKINRKVAERVLLAIREGATREAAASAGPIELDIVRLDA
jgi:hypothetical protein